MASRPPTPETPADAPTDIPPPSPGDTIPHAPLDPVVEDYPPPGTDPLHEGP